MNVSDIGLRNIVPSSERKEKERKPHASARQWVPRCPLGERLDDSTWERPRITKHLLRDCITQREEKTSERKAPVSFRFAEPACLLLVASIP